MTIEIKVPQLPESVSDAVVSKGISRRVSLGMDDNIGFEIDKVGSASDGIWYDRKNSKARGQHCCFW